MFGLFLDPTKRLQKRYLRASKHLQTLQEKAARVSDPTIRESLVQDLQKLATLRERLSHRVEELPLTRDASFEWLRADFDKTLTLLETALEELRERLAPLVLLPSPPSESSNHVSSQPQAETPLHSPTTPGGANDAVGSRTASRQPRLTSKASSSRTRTTTMATVANS